jgi:hypothetical protein
MVASRDPFSKTSDFEGGRTAMPDYKAGHGLGVSFSLADCGKPHLFVHPSYFGDDWLFMNRVSFLMNDRVALDLELTRPSREATGSTVFEMSAVSVPAEQISVLRAMPAASDLLVRLSGDKGIRTIGKKAMQAFLADLSDALQAFDAVTAYASSSQCSPTAKP